jgi:hypothetical protein
MTTKAERLLGLTPAFKRIAHYYVCLGFGEYHPKQHPHYDRVIVRELYEFGENPRVEGEHAGGTIVEFYQGTQRVKWVEFRCQVTGGGGEDVIKRVK